MPASAEDSFVAFAEGEDAWVARLRNLRNAVRQELVSRQLAEHIVAKATVLDVGCGQGTQALRLLERGSAVVGVDVSDRLLERFRRDAERSGHQPELLHGSIDSLDQLLGDRTFQLVCAHGLLMYLPDTTAALATLSGRVEVGGLLSITFRNADALALRPGLRRDWKGALAAFDSSEYVNELGLAATAHHLEDVAAGLHAAGFEVIRWYGVRVFNDAVPGDMPVPDDEDWAALVAAEDCAGRQDPYRWMASQLHVIAHAPSQE